MRYLRFLLSGEVIFFLFLFSGVFKEAFGELPLDLTLILMFWSCAIAGRKLMKYPALPKSSLVPIIVFSLFTVLLILSLYYTPSENYAYEKTLKFLSVTAWSFIGPFILIRDKASLEKFLKACISVTVLISLFVLYQYATASNINSWTRVAVGVGGDETGNVLGLGRLAGIGIITVLLMYVYKTDNLRHRILCFVGMGVMALTLLLTGSRMPLVALIATLIFVIPLSFKFKRDKILYNKGVVSLLVMMVLTVLVLIPFKEKAEPMIYRIQVLFSESGGGSSVTERIDRFDTAFDMWGQNVIAGKGIGSFPLFYTGNDQREYAHNMFLETLSELGMLGFIVLSVLVVLAFIKVLRYKKSNDLSNIQLCLLLISVFMFLNVNVTGDLNDNRAFFTFISLLFMIDLYSDAKKEQQTIERSALLPQNVRGSISRTAL